jgi:hypothetical protein
MTSSLNYIQPKVSDYSKLLQVHRAKNIHLKNVSPFQCVVLRGASIQEKTYPVGDHPDLSYAGRGAMFILFRSGHPCERKYFKA